MDKAQQIIDASQELKDANLLLSRTDCTLFRIIYYSIKYSTMAAKHFSSAVNKFGSNQYPEAVKSRLRQEAIACLNQVISIHEGKPDQLASAEKLVADLYEAENQYEAAVTHYLNAAYYFALINKNSMNRGCMIRVADLNAYLEKYDTSVQIYEQIASELDDMHKYNIPELLFKASIMRLLLQDLERVEVALGKYSLMSPYFAQTRQFTLITKLRQAIAINSADMFSSAIVEYDSGACMDRWYQIMFLRMKQRIVAPTERI